MHGVNIIAPDTGPDSVKTFKHKSSWWSQAWTYTSVSCWIRAHT